MNNHRYILEKYKGMKTRFVCPSCNDKQKTFVRYIDTETNEYLNSNAGRCNRETSCGYHYTPKQYFNDNPKGNNEHTFYEKKPLRKSYSNATVTPQLIKPSYIPVDVFKLTLVQHNVNNFVRFLNGLFGAEVSNDLVRKYFIGTSKHWNGSTIFWQIDRKGKIRTGKIMLYNAENGKRVKEPTNHIYWVHKAIKQANYELNQCLFGEHLLVDESKPIAIVESEKTAIISSVYLPQFLWLAVGSLTNLNEQNCTILKGRNVTLFPDLNGFEKWSSLAKELSKITQFKVSDLLQQKATETDKSKGLDLADYLIKFDYKAFIQPQSTISTNKEKTAPIEPKLQIANDLQLTNFKLTYDWDKVINEAETMSLNYNIITPLKLNDCSLIIDVPKFINSHLEIIKSNKNNKTFIPYLNRLQELIQIIN